mgnify:CR=1 FL=1
MKCIGCQTVEANTGSVCKDCRDIVNAAIVGIDAARCIGVPKYGPSSWRDDKEHIWKAYLHIQAYLIELGLDPEEYPDIPDYDVDEDHLSHAICRLAMAKALTCD